MRLWGQGSQVILVIEAKSFALNLFVLFCFVLCVFLLQVRMDLNGIIFQVEKENQHSYHEKIS